MRFACHPGCIVPCTQQSRSFHGTKLVTKKGIYQKATVISPVLLHETDMTVSSALYLGMYDWLDERTFVTKPDVLHSSNSEPYPSNSRALPEIQT